MTCPVCLYRSVDVRLGECWHGLCGECLREWLVVSESCPLCRAIPTRLLLHDSVPVSVDEFVRRDPVIQRRMLYKGLLQRDDSHVPVNTRKGNKERARVFVERELKALLGQVDQLLVQIVTNLICDEAETETHLADYLGEVEAKVFWAEARSYLTSGLTWEAYLQAMQYSPL